MMRKLAALIFLLLIATSAHATNTPPPGIAGDYITNANGSQYGATTPSQTFNNVNGAFFIDPRDPQYGAKCDGATFPSGRPVQNGTDNDTTAFHNAMVAGAFLGAAVMVPDGCWVSGLTPVTGAALVGQGWAINYGYDYNNGKPWTKPVLYVIGAPSFGINLNGVENFAMVGFEINANSNSGAFGSTSCVGSSTGSQGFGGKVWSFQMSYKGCNWGVRPTGGFVYFVSENSDYGANNNGIGGTISDYLSIADTFVSESGTGINLEGGNGQFDRILSPRLEFNNIGINGSSAFEVNVDNAQFDHHGSCAINLTTWGRFELTGGAIRGGGLNGSLTVTGAANNGSGLIRLAVSSQNSPATSGVSTGNTVTVANVGGTTEANGNWTITVIDGSHIDLQSSSFVNAFTSGGFVGAWGKDADICLAGGSGFHAVNVDFESQSAVNGPVAPAYIIDTTASGVSNVDILSGQGAATSYGIAIANWETFGVPTNTHIDILGSPLLRNDTTSGSIGALGQMGIGTKTPSTAAILDLSGGTGALSSLLLPRDTTGNRPTPATGMFRYNTSTNTPEVYNGSNWITISGNPVVAGSLGGLTLSNDVSTPNTIIDIAAGAAASSDITATMTLPLAITKTTGAWTVGTGNGCLDTGSVASATWYHVFIIERLDTAVVDILCSTSATIPTLPTNYTVSRRIGSFLTDGSAHIIAFTQIGSTFYWTTPLADVTTTSLGSTSALETLTVPPGVQVTPLCNLSMASASPPVSMYVTSPSESDLASTTTTPFSAAPGYSYLSATATGQPSNAACPFLTTNTSSQIRARASGSSTSLSIITRGWID